MLSNNFAPIPVKIPIKRSVNNVVITVTVNLTLNYRRECCQGEVLTISTRPERLGRTSFVVRQEIKKAASGELAADATVTMVTIDVQTRRPVPVPKILAELFG